MTLQVFSRSGLTALDRPVDPRPLSFFRIVFGLFMIYEMVDYIRIGLVRNMFVLPAVNFSYDGLTWMHPLPEWAMDLILYTLLGCAVLITLGLFFRWACLLFALGYAYLFLLDKSIYNNHIYLFILMALLLSITAADRSLSIRHWKGQVQRIPFWQIGLFQVQIVIVYFYGGIAKLTWDWLVLAQPVTLMVGALPEDSFFERMFNNEAGIAVMNYGGLLLDLLAPCLLWVKPVRRYAIYPFVGFHLTNSQVFDDIGIFPFVMLFSLLLYYSADDLRWFYARLPGTLTSGSRMPGAMPGASSLRSNKRLRYALIFYLGVQLLAPFRGLFLPNDLDWTTIGNRFSWRMKVDSRHIDDLAIAVASDELPNGAPVNFGRHLNEMQILHMTKDPRSLRQYARFLEEDARLRGGMTNPRVYAKVVVRYNGRPPQYFIDPAEDLSKAELNLFKPIAWLNPITPPVP